MDKFTHLLIVLCIIFIAVEIIIKLIERFNNPGYILYEKARREFYYMLHQSQPMNEEMLKKYLDTFEMLPVFDISGKQYLTRKEFNDIMDDLTKNSFTYKAIRKIVS